MSIPKPPKLPSILSKQKSKSNSIPLPPNLKKKEIKKKEFFDDINWTNIDTVKLSEEGSGGVIFVSFKNNEHPPVVVKGTSTIVQEIFALELAYLLKINAPRYYLINFTQSAFRQVQYQLSRRVGVRSTKVSRELNRPFFMIMEHVNGLDIFSIAKEKGKEEIIKYLSNDIFLEQMGNIMALDVLLNNFDRLPLIWENQGNLENFLFTKLDNNNNNNKQCVYAIDQAIYPVTKGLIKNYDGYLNRVKNLLEDITCDNWSLIDNSPLYKVKESIILWTGIDIGDSGIKHLRKGLLQTFKIISLFSDTILDDLKSKVASFAKVDWENVYKRGLEAIKLEFMDDIIRIIKNHKDKIELLTQ